MPQRVEDLAAFAADLVVAVEQLAASTAVPPPRGLDNARDEWNLLATCHNLRKLHGHVGVTALGSLRPAI